MPPEVMEVMRGDEMSSCILVLVGVGRVVVCTKVVDSAIELWTTVLSSTETVSDV